MPLSNHEKKLTYFDVPKNASTSMRACLEGWDERRDPAVAGYDEKTIELLEYYRFTIVRDPTQRFISAFSQHCLSEKIMSTKEKQEKLEETVRSLDLISPDLLDFHFRRQEILLKKSLIDRYFTFENLGNSQLLNGWEKFRLVHGLRELPHLNSRRPRVQSELWKPMERGGELNKIFWNYYSPDWELWQFAKYREEHPWELK